MNPRLRAVILRTSSIATWIASTSFQILSVVAVLLADVSIWVLLLTRTNERRIRPTERVSWPKGLKRRLMRRQDNTCVYCAHRRIATSMDIDHIIPVVRGGSNDENNLQVICRRCNQRKGLQTDEEFRTRYARLVPQRRLTPPRRRISQREFKEETRLTRQTDSVQEFRRTRFISKREKISGGCLVLGGGVGVGTLLLLSSWGAEGFLLLLPAVVVGGAAGGGVWFRAYTTGAMIEDDDQ